MPRSTDPLLSLPDSEGVLYVRLYQRMRALILNGSWPSGMRLPSSRTLAADLGISRNTATLALEQLLADGWIETRSRAGTYVGADAAAAHPPRQSTIVQQARPGKPPVPFEIAQAAIDTFPIDRWARLQSRIWSRAVPDLLYETDAMGDPGLRRAIADVVAPARGLSLNPDDLLIVTSMKAGLDLLAVVLPPNSAIVVEDPGYILADSVFTRRGHRLLPVPIDEDGLDVAAARRAEPRPALIVTTPAAQFPLGRPMGVARRAELLDWAAESGAWVVDDDFDANANFDGLPPMPPLKSADSHGCVIYSSSFNRLLFGSLRLGFMALPTTLRDPVERARRDLDEFVNLPNQLVLRAFIEEGGYAAHLRHSRELHRARREALLKLLRPYFGSVISPDINTHGLWLVIRPLSSSVDELATRLREAGIACMTIGDFTRGESGVDGVVLGFAAFSEDVIVAMRPAIEKALAPIR